ncbi:MAG: glycosyltransferase family 2 protein [Anaerolineae bacterium]|jgi:(heptosyl)LPS beta-1,4-glucosyltransferase
MGAITAAILAANNEDDIGACLDSVAWADALLVVLDTRSTDRTGELARARGARVEPHPFHDFGAQRNYALEQADSEWVFFLDTDERCTPALALELRQAAERADYDGWWVPRRNIIFGDEIRHGGWYPDHQMRLLRRSRARYDPHRQVHEVVLLDGQAGYLHEPLLHYNYRSVAQFAAKQRQYVALEAQIRYQDGIRPRPWTYLLQPLREFWRRYVTLQGYRDGWPGLRLCALVAYHYGLLVTWRLGRLWRASKKGRG